LNTEYLRNYGTLLLICGILLFSALNSYELRRSTEPRVAGIAAEMLIGGDWLMPRLNGDPFLEKPPLYLWLGAGAMRWFGIKPLAARLPSAVAGAITVFLLMRTLGRRRQSAAYAFLAALLLVTTGSFWSNSRQAGQDSLLTLGITLTLLSFFDATQSACRRFNWAFFSLGVAIATLSKGVVGLAIPGVVILAYLILEYLLVDRRLVAAKWLLPAFGTLAGLIPIAIWLLLLYKTHGWDAFYEVTWVNSVGRFVGEYDRGGHSEPFYYYLRKLPETFQPWTILVFLSLWHYLKQARRDRFTLFLNCWLVAPFILLSISSGKRSVYLLSIYPAAAILAAQYCRHLFDNSGNPRSTTILKLLIRFYGSAMSIGAAIIIIGLYQLKPPFTTSFTTTVLLLFLVITFWRAQFYGHYRMAGACCIAVIIIGYHSYASVMRPKEDYKESLLPIFTEFIKLRDQGFEIALFKPNERISGAVVFYTGSTTPALRNLEELRAFLLCPGKKLALMQTAPTDYPEKLKILQTYTIGRHDYFFVSNQCL
jgi:4-amino-4-deoxy-L-arabinose transferase-like glycosyltransferase